MKLLNNFKTGLNLENKPFILFLKSKKMLQPLLQIL